VLEPLGFTPTAEAVYRAILAHRGWGVQQIADHLDLTVKEVKEALDQLAALTLVDRSPDPDRPLTAARPDVGLAALLVNAQAQVQARQHEIATAVAAIAAISAEHGAMEERDSAIRHVGLEAVRRRLGELSASTSRECLSMNPNVAQTPDAKDASRPLNEQVLQRGVAIRCLYQQSFANHPGLVAYARWLTSLGGQIRTVPAVPMLMVIYDRSTLIVPIDPTDSSKGALEVRSDGIVTLACALFDQVWMNASPYGEAPRTDHSGLNAVERHLLHLLGAGHTDDQAARRLGISLSTVRRMIAVLMDRLDARSRFQAGVRAAERGWTNLGGEPM
jgi:DNA-binding NarL/FixJ family response regulator